ncbi:MAG: septal ring lytic transglycosylase RlpA family protein [Gammaproteobacteria bacterium]
MERIFVKVLIGFIIGFLLSGCGSTKRIFYPTSKPDPSIDLSKIPNAVPRHESKSRYGNPKSYVVFGRRYYTLNSAIGLVETGVASWYGPNFHGKKTSSQEVYDMNQMTAAHKTIPIPSYVQVTNLRNGKRVVVRVNDRGPFHDNRIIDLSYVAAAKLDIVKAGTGMVEIRVIDPANPQAHNQVQQQRRNRPPPPTNSTQKPVAKKQITKARQGTTAEKQLFIQLGAFSELDNAQKFRSRIQNSLNKTSGVIVSIATIPVQGKPLYKVRIGPLADIETSDRIVGNLNAAGLYDHHVLFQ